MTAYKKRIEHGQARVEFIRNLDEIRKMLGEGYTIRAIHRKLIEDGKITMSYTSLHQFVHPRKR